MQVLIAAKKIPTDLQPVKKGYQAELKQNLIDPNQ